MRKSNAPTAPRLQALAAADWPADGADAAAMAENLFDFLTDADSANRDWAIFCWPNRPLMVLMCAMP